MLFDVQRKVKDLIIVESTFTSVDYLVDDIDNAVSVSTVVILLFSFEIYKIASTYMTSLKNLFAALLINLRKSMKFSIFCLIPFIFMSSLFSYFLYGDFASAYYRFYSFHFIKSITSFYRGSIENVDFDDSVNRRTSSVDNNINSDDTHYKG